jgi:phage-related holin
MEAFLFQLQTHGIAFLMCSIILLLFVLIDLIDGVRTARIVGERVRSHKLRDTITKFLSYWLFTIVGALIDIIGAFSTQAWEKPYVTLAMTLIAGIIELHSLKEHATKRKDNAAKIEDLLKAIINASNKSEAKSLLPRITEILENENKNTEQQ